MKKVLRGYWWLPSKPEEQWYGKLRWTNRKSPLLKLRYKTAEQSSAPPDSEESVFGFDSHGTPISLLRVGRLRTRTSEFLSQSNYCAGHLLRGIHATRYKDVRLNRVDFWLQYLGSWLGEEGFSRDVSEGGAHRVEYRRPHDREYPLTSDITLKLCHCAKAASKSRERILSYDVFFALESKRQMSLGRAYRFIDYFRNLIHFSSLKKVFSTAITIENFDDRFHIADQSFPKEIEVYNGSLHEELKKDSLRSDFVFTFKDVESRFAELCLKWLRFHVEYREAIGCYTSTIYGELSSALQLISLTQGLEAFHERRYRPKNKAALFANRIKDLCEKQGQRMIQVVGDLDKFSESVKDSRHYYTHHDPAIRKRGAVLSGAKLTIMTFQLQYLFRLCVLKEFDLLADPFGMLQRQLPSRFIEYY